MLTGGVATTLQPRGISFKKFKISGCKGEIKAGNCVVGVYIKQILNNNNNNQLNHRGNHKGNH